MPVRRGADYIKALRDGREVWHAGKRIADVTAHSGFTGTIKTLADMYDKQHTPEHRDHHDRGVRGRADFLQLSAAEESRGAAAQAAQYRILGAADFRPDGALSGVRRRADRRSARLVACDRKDQQTMGRQCPRLSSLRQPQRSLSDPRADRSVLRPHQAGRENRKIPI